MHTEVKIYPAKKNEYVKWEQFCTYKDYDGTSYASYEVRLATFPEDINQMSFVPRTPFVTYGVRCEAHLASQMIENIQTGGCIPAEYPEGHPYPSKLWRAANANS